MLKMDDNVDFNSINIGRSLNMAKRKDSPPSRKIIIAQNKVGSINDKNIDIRRKTMTNIKTSTNDHLNKIYNLTKDKKAPNDENLINMKPKPIKYNLGSNELLSTNRKRNAILNPDTNRESSIERSLSKTKSSFKNLVSPRTAASKLVRATDSVDMGANSVHNYGGNYSHHSQSSLQKTLSKDLSRDKISIIKTNKEETVPVKLFKKN
mmetsp:Transcript_40790/g.34398  ORF Transcript_40790/g.34398 Transcript_40790/m.34398 type:complete len:208 (+) Transcript_40790:1436-2059(+)